MTMETRSTREALGDALVELGGLDGDVVVIDADAASSTHVKAFADGFPDRYYNVGIAEQNMIEVASGMALVGKKPYATAFSSFLAGRAYDQIRCCVAMPNLNVKLIATHAGITVGEDGATHQMLEDVALMRVLPNMSVMVPADYWSARNMIISSIKSDKPLYVRLGRAEVPMFYSPRDEFVIGGGRIVREGKDVTIVACGIMLFEALKAADILARQEIEAEVIDCYSIKPLPEDLIQSSVRRTGCCVVAEEHNRIGGLCGAVAESLSVNYPVPVRFVAIDDRFGESGTPAELQEYYSIKFREIVGAVAQVWVTRRR